MYGLGIRGENFIRHSTSMETLYSDADKRLNQRDTAMKFLRNSIPVILAIGLMATGPAAAMNSQADQSAKAPINFSLSQAVADSLQNKLENKLEKSFMASLSAKTGNHERADNCVCYTFFRWQ